MHDEERNGRLSEQTDEIVSQVNQKLRSNRRLTVSAMADEFPHLRRTIVYTIFTENFGCQTVCKVGTENPRGPAQRATNVL